MFMEGINIIENIKKIFKSGKKYFRICQIKITHVT